MSKKQIKFNLECINNEMEQIDLYYSNTGDGIWPFSVEQRYRELEYQKQQYEKLLNKEENI